jgi:Carboxypeptidase regulatory-like domain
MSLLTALSVAAALAQAPAAPSAASVAGQVIEDASGASIEGAQVTVMPVRSGLVVSRPDLPPSVGTDRDGRFQIRGLEPGRYRIAVQKAGYALPFGPAATTPLELAAGEEPALTLSLQRGAAIVGRVVNEAGEPLVGLRVMALTSRETLVAPRGTPATFPGLVPAGSGAQTNDLGEFRLFGLPPGDYYVQAAPVPFPGPSRTVPPRPRTLVTTYFPDVTDPAGAHAITLGIGQTSDAIVIRMGDAQAFQVSGIVEDETGQPVSNAMVRLDLDSSTTGPLFGPGGYLTARTNTSGAFTISNVTGATYTLVAIAPLVTSSGTDSRLVGGGSVISFGSASSSGPISGGSFSESRNGVTTSYRGDLATRATISVNQADVTGLQVVVRLPQR